MVIQSNYMSGHSVLWEFFKLYLVAFINQIEYSIEATNIFISARSSVYTSTQTEGYSYFCPCCEVYIKEWLDWSSYYRKVECPKCGLHPRQRLFQLHLNQHPELLQGHLKVLHFAPERIFQMRFSAMKNLEYITADLNDPSVDIKIDITDIPYPADTFDVILCSHVLEHIPDDRKAMSEILRVLKPGGWAHLQVPIDSTLQETFEDPAITSPDDRLRYFGQTDHVRMYGLDYEERLKEAGFTLKVEDVHQQLSVEEQKKYGIYDHLEKLYFVLKPC